MNKTQNFTNQLVDVDPRVRLAAALTIGTQRDAASAAAVVARLGQENDCRVRETLTWAAVQLRDEVSDQIVAKLDDPQASVRQQAAHVLSKIGDPEHAQHLAGVLADQDPEVAIKAFRAAANTGSPTVVPALVARLGDPDGELRDGLTRAFNTLGEVAVDALTGALTSPEAAVREHAADALGHLGSPAADAAVDALAGLLADSSAEVRVTAVSALGQLDPELTGDVLGRAADGDDPVVAAVAASHLSAARKRAAAE